jgi:carboxymethylenebutenolidase
MVAAHVLRSGGAPLLGLFGGAHRAISRGDVNRFREALDEAGVPNELVVYEGAPHSFFDRTFDQHPEASQESWRRLLAFVARLSASN